MAGGHKPPLTFPMPEPEISRNQHLLNAAVNEVLLECPKANENMEDLLERVSAKFLNMKLDDFPRMCDVARIQNKIKFDNLKDVAKAGKYDAANNQTTLWSDDHTFMYDFDIPQELYVFMVNFVYKGFWTEGNAKVWRRFMKALCARDASMTNYEAMNLLIKVKQIYGSNSDITLTN